MAAAALALRPAPAARARAEFAGRWCDVPPLSPRGASLYRSGTVKPAAREAWFDDLSESVSGRLRPFVMEASEKRDGRRPETDAKRQTPPSRTPLREN